MAANAALGTEDRRQGPVTEDDVTAGEARQDVQAAIEDDARATF